MMPSANEPREIRVFLSSTFKDMDQERSHLLTNVFPRLRRLCDERQVVFSEIDLRWGVSEESSRNGRTVEICLDEIDRCRKYPPFFIGILGERYGWRPQRDELATFWIERSASPYAQRIEAAIDSGISATELEIEHGVMADQVALPHAHIYLRAPELTAQLFDASHATNPSVTPSDFYDGAGGKLDALKQRLRRSGIAIGDYASVERFGEAVHDFLKAGIDALFPAEPAVSASKDGTHAVYAWSRRRDYLALPAFRTDVLSRLDLGLAGRAAPYLCIHGESGLGKSAFIADLHAHLMQEDRAWVFAHYIGADGDRSLNGWRDRLLARLEETGAGTVPASTDDKERWTALGFALCDAQHALQKPVVLLLDALDQSAATNAVQVLNALKLRGQVIMIATATSQVRTPGWQLLAMPALDLAQRRGAIALFLASCGKELSPALQDRLAASPACALALFMRLILEELRVHARNDDLVERLEDLLRAADAGALFRAIVKAMDADFDQAFHPRLASHAVRLVAASRRGLRRMDLACLLASPASPVEPASGRRRLPDRVLSPLLARLEPFCLNDEGRLSIMHRSLLTALVQSDDIAGMRRQLADYFSNLAKPDFAEHLYQLQHLEDTDGAVALLTNIALPLSLAQKEPVLLRDVLGWLGARSPEMTVPIHQIGVSWAKTIMSLDKLWMGNFMAFSSWLSDNGFLTLQESWLIAIVQWFNGLGRLSMGRQLAKPMQDLAALYCLQEKWESAEALSSIALEVARVSFAPDDPAIADHLLSLARVYEDTGQHDKAVSLYREALDLRKRKLAPGDPRIASALNCVALVLVKGGRHVEGERAYREAVNIFRQSLRPGHPRIAAIMSNLSQLYERQGRHADALVLSEEELAIYQSEFGPCNHQVGISLQNQAGIHLGLRDSSRAEQALRQALAIYRQTLPPNHSDIRNCLRQLSYLCRDPDRVEEANMFDQEASDIADATPGAKSNFQQAAHRNNKACSYLEQGDLQQAEAHFREALALCEQDAPPDPMILDILVNLAELCIRRQQLGEADALLGRAHKLIESFDLGRSPSMRRLLRTMSILRGREGRWHETENLLRAAIDLCREALPDTARELLGNLRDMAKLYQFLGRDADAQAVDREMTRQTQELGFAAAS